MLATPSVKFDCSLVFRDAWRATPEQIDTLISKMIDSFANEGVTGLTFHGDITHGTLTVRFDAPTVDDEDMLDYMGILVRALNAGRVKAPGWPGDQVIDDAIASVSVRECGFDAAA